MDVIKTTSKNIQKQRPKTLNDIYNQKFPLVDFSHKMKKIDKEIKSFLKYNMYNHKMVIKNTNNGKKIISDLFEYLLKNHKKYIKKKLFNYEEKERVVADFIAGMTDRYAINLYNKLK